MASDLDDLRVLRGAEEVADGIWREVMSWEGFVRDVLGGQLARAADSIGANIAEAFGRFHYGEKLQFLYYARGSLYETKYWLNRAQARGIMAPVLVGQFGGTLSTLAHQLNTFALSLKRQRKGDGGARVVREDSAEYTLPNGTHLLFTPADLAYLSNPDLHPISQSPNPPISHSPNPPFSPEQP